MGTLGDVLLRLNAFKAVFPGMAAKRAAQIADRVAHELGDAAPHGVRAPHLSDSFEGRSSGSGRDLRATVVCTMGTRLKYVVEGTGIYGEHAHRIVPVRAKALYWPLAAHPYASVAGQKPNDFVTPVLNQQRSPVEIELLREDAAKLLVGG